MPDLGITVNVKNTVEMHKIQELLQKAGVEILVGFPSGRPHIQAVHEPVKDKDGKQKVDKNGNRVYKGGSKVQKKADGTVLETWELAEALHFGSASVPARPFLTDGLESKQKELLSAVQEQAEKAMNGERPNWEKVGSMAKGAVDEFVRSDYYKTHIPNSKEWQETKGSDTPLIDGGDLIGSLEFIVENK